MTTTSKTATRSPYWSAGQIIPTWRERLFSGEKPKRFRLAAEGPIADIPFGPGRILLIGGAPGSGKTSFISQCVVDALRLDPGLGALVANVEMTETEILSRQLARLSGIPAELIQDHSFGVEHHGRIEAGLAALDEVQERLFFVRSPIFFDGIAAAALDIRKAGIKDLIIVVDYIQRIPKSKQDKGDRRAIVDSAMTDSRRLAQAGFAVIVIAAVGRQRNSQGSSYSGSSMDLGAFRDSSELEYGCDLGYILAGEPHDPSRTLRHFKNRHGQLRDIALKFNGSVQRFDIDDFAVDLGAEETPPLKRQGRRQKRDDEPAEMTPEAARAAIWGDSGKGGGI